MIKITYTSEDAHRIVNCLAAVDRLLEVSNKLLETGYAPAWLVAEFQNAVDFAEGHDEPIR